MSNTFKIERRYRLDKVASRKSRYAVTGALVSGSKAVATNNHALAVVPIVGDVTEPVIFPVEVWAKGVRAVSTHERAVFTANGYAVVEVGSETSTGAFVEGDFPQYQAVMVDPDETETAVTLDAKLLLELAQALGSDGQVTLQLPAEIRGMVRGAIRVTVPGDDEAEGVIMPIA